MAERRDKLGRRIPEFDRSAAGKKASQTRRANKKYGPDYDKRTGAIGGSHRTRGYFGKLKDEGREEELKALSEKGTAKSVAIRKAKKEAQASETSTNGSGENSTIPGGE